MKLAGFLLLAIPAWAQYGTRIGQIQSVALDESNPNLHAEFETWVEQRSRDYAESVVTGNSGVEREPGKAAIHRFVRDNFRHTSQTYTVTLESMPEAGTLRVSFSDADVPYPAPQTLRDGETIAVVLSTDARTGRRLVEYIRAGSGTMTPRQAVARDVYAEDAALAITQPSLRVNGVAATLSVTASAPVVQVEIPGYGRFALSFKPRSNEGFERAGEAAGNTLLFSSGGNVFRIDSAERIATGSGTYNIYARKE